MKILIIKGSEEGEGGESRSGRERRVTKGEAGVSEGRDSGPGGFWGPVRQGGAVGRTSKRPVVSHPPGRPQLLPGPHTPRAGEALCPPRAAAGRGAACLASCRRPLLPPGLCAVQPMTVRPQDSPGPTLPTAGMGIQSAQPSGDPSS